MALKFFLEIELGDDAMQTNEDVASALRDTANYIGGIGVYEEGEQIRWHLDAGHITDVNGNTVGEWEVR